MSATLQTPATDEERGALAQVLASAFGFEAPQALPWFDKAGHDNVRMWARDGRVLGGLLVEPLGQFLGGRSVSTAGIAGVGVRTDHLRQGEATGMMRATLRQAHADGYGLSSLYASNQPLYKRVGYAQAGMRMIARVSPGALQGRARALATREMTPADFPHMERIYRRWAVAFDGHLDRGPYCWGRLREPGHRGTPSGLVLGPADDPQGYVTWMRRDLPGQGFHELVVLDLAASSRAALDQLVGLLADLSTMARRVTLPTGPSDPVYGAAPHPWWEVELEEMWMVRVVNVATALEQRGYPVGLTVSVDLHVEDDVIGENNGAAAATVRISSAMAACACESRKPP